MTVDASFMANLCGEYEGGGGKGGLKKGRTHREVASVEGMNYKGFVADVYHSGYAVAGLERGCRTWHIFHRSVVVAVLDFLPKCIRRQLIRVCKKIKK